MIHVPVLRRGKAYRSLDVVRLTHHRTREVVAEVSQANPGLIRRDLLDTEGMRAALERIPAAELVDLCARAATHFVHDPLPLGEATQTPDDYVRQTSSTTGLPHVLVRRNMAKIEGVLREMRTILDGLTRGLDLAVLDRGLGEVGGHALSFVPRTPTLGAVLPNNSPGVHSLWLPAVPLKTALVLKPGRAEPWTPFRIVQAFLRAGAPAEAFAFYPADHAGAGEILRACGRSMLFGDVGSTRSWHGDPRIEVHGPGYSKVLLGPDADAERHLDVIVASVLENSGRSCVNASGVWVIAPGRGRDVADALARRLVGVEPRREDDAQAQLAPFLDPNVAARISASIDDGLREPGAVDVTAALRGGPRLITWEGATYLLPTVVHCSRPDHPLANREFLFPFASVVDVAAADVPAALGPTLALTALTDDAALTRRLVASPLIQRLNLGPIPTPRVSWDQPHEGNLFEHLWTRRAVQSLATMG
jgi:hypothetical protein